MQFGMMNSPAVFQQAMNELLSEMIGQGVVVYLDDIIVYAKTKEQLVGRTKEVLEKLRQADFYLKPEKCFFNKNELDYLGFVVNQDGLKMDQYKVKAILEWPTPQNKKDIRKFIGFGNFYRKFIKDYAAIARPITKLISKKKLFE